MNNLTLSTSQTQIDSPFDAIRGYRADGSEYWTARELMRWLGYAKWQNAQKAIERAIKSLENQGYISSEHLTGVSNDSRSNGLGVQEIKDFELSRLGCYTVAMNADPEKEMVALAQGYFAAKTREAELKPKTNIQMLVEVAQEMARQEQIQIAQAKEIELIKQQQALEAARIDELAQLTHQHDAEIDRIYSPNGHYFSVIGYARNRGLSIGIETAKDVGRKCSTHCKSKGIKIEKLNDPRFGTVGSYPESVIELYI
jgi:DNA-damage-inducible protein D